MYQDAIWYIGLGPSQIVLDGSQLTSQKGTQHPNFWRMYIVAKRLYMSVTTWYGGRPQPRQHCVRWEPSSPPLKRSTPPKFSAHVRCGQTAGWTKMSLGLEVGLDPGDFVSDGDPVPAPPEKGTAPTQFLAHVYCG